MKLDGLMQLYKSMRSQDIDRYRFEYAAGKANFDVFFFIDGSPYILLFGVKGANFSFEIAVKKGFVIDPSLDRETYKKLCEVLGLVFDPNNPFKPANFFAEFNKHIPQEASIHNKVYPHQIAQYKRVVEEANKIYFFGWRDNTKRGENVRPENLDKTREYLGENAYKRCMQKNISSCWTDQKNKAIEFTLPA